MNVGPVADLPPWSEEDLRARFQELQVRGIRGLLYDKQAVDQLMVDMLGLFKSMNEAIQAANRRAEIAEGQREEAKAAAEGYIDQLSAFTADNPDQVLMPLQARATLERAQEEADQIAADARFYAKQLVEDAHVTAEAMMAEAATSVRSIGHLTEPDGEDPIAVADWLDAADEYITLRREETDLQLSDQIQKWEAARLRVRKADPSLNTQAASVT